MIITSKASFEEITATIEELSVLAEELNENLSKFKFKV